MAENTGRLQVTLDLKTLAFLERLGGKGTHGKDDKAVARTLIENGIREAIKEGFLTAADVANIQGQD